MKLNSEKTKIVLLGTKDLLRKSGSFQIDVGDEKSLSSSDGSKGVKSLGVKIDENLNMRQQIAQVRQSSFYAISNLKKHPISRCEIDVNQAAHSFQGGLSQCPLCEPSCL